MLNKIVLHGRFTRDPELRRTQAGKAVTSFTLAVDRDIKNQDGSRTADFIDCVAWEKLGEMVQQWFRKGSEALVSGRLQSRDWTDKQGNKRRAWEIVCDKVEFCGGRQDGGGGRQIDGPTGDFAELADDDGDVPF